MPIDFQPSPPALQLARTLNLGFMCALMSTHTRTSLGQSPQFEGSAAQINFVNLLDIRILREGEGPCALVCLCCA